MTPLQAALLRRAISLALEAHGEQLDKAGEPYILHPLAVMQSVREWDEKVVAVLHDVLEDTYVTVAVLESEGFPPHIVEALCVLTHGRGESYLESYLPRVRANTLATLVKLADIAHNSSPVRLAQLDRETRERLTKQYLEANLFLTMPGVFGERAS